MKKIFISISAMCFSLGVMAQETSAEAPDFHRVEFGFRFMPTVTQFKMQTYEGGTVAGQATFGYGIGGLIGFNFTNHVGVEADIIYNSLSQKYKDQTMEKTIHINYMNFPVLLSLNTGKANPVNLNFVVGPQMGYNLGSSISSSGSNGTDTITTIVAVKKGDVGFAYGAGLEFMLNDTRTIRLDLGFRGVFGFLDIQEPATGVNTKSYNVINHTNIKTYSAFAGFSFLF